MEKNKVAKLTALRDITEDCAKRGSRNYLYCEKEVCAYAGIPVPDFRYLNGVYSRKDKSEFLNNITL